MLRGSMYKEIETYCSNLLPHFDDIAGERKEILRVLAKYIVEQRALGKPVNLVYVCTHNSRRSHFGQVWAKVASVFFGLKEINTFSGGTEATAFHPNAIAALKRVGFKIETLSSGNNPLYEIKYDEIALPLQVFSKLYNDPLNPSEHFAAIMTCGEAEENCPFIPGVDLRIGTTYEDPKIFDGTELRDTKYDERCRQIALETLFVFSRINEL